MKMKAVCLGLFAILASLIFPLSRSECPEANQWECSNGTCIQKTGLCDNWNDCTDGSDERKYDSLNTTEQNTGFNCSSGCFLPEKYKCDGYKHCKTDECDCDDKHHIRCSDDECIPEEEFCVEKFEPCENREDILKYNKSLRNSHVWCMNIHGKDQCALSAKHHLCDGRAQCLHAGDECFCGNNNTEYDATAIMDSTCFRCLDGHGEMLNTHVCDGFFDCSDLSDECLCDNFMTPSTCKQVVYGDENCEFRCKPNGTPRQSDCINKTQICDKKEDCTFGEDEKYCPLVKFWRKNLGNIYHDGPSDELSCCNAGYKPDCLEETTNKSSDYNCSTVLFKCPFDIFNDAYLPFAGYGIECDGIPLCGVFRDECEGKCNVNGTEPSFCVNKGSSGFRCNTTVLNDIEITRRCDGRPDCSEKLGPASSDEVNCDRFYCKAVVEKKSLVSIKKSAQCDCIEDCENGADEQNCTKWKKFCCSDRKEAVELNKVCNGVNDCDDGSDECQDCLSDTFSDDRQMIKNPVLQSFVWIIGLVSSAGNVYVLVSTTLKLRNSNLPVLGKVSSYQILGLSFADLCVGIYLISLGIVNAVHSGIYCTRDSSWRSSSACNFLGILSMFGMEASVFMLTAMTISRLYVVSRPFQSHTVWKSAVLIGFIMLTALLLAVIPVFPSSQDFFMSTVKLKKNPFRNGFLDRENLSHFVDELASYSTDEHNFRKILGESKNLYPWKNIFNALSHLNDSIEPQFEFGYYSSHGVCLARFFSLTSDTAWQYSFFLIFLNFLFFFVIAVSYVAIYKITTSKTARAKGSGGYSEQTKLLQRKITRIILTDFCCWMPICLISYIKLGGASVSDEVYAVSAIIILPINSALNPFLYSNLPDAIWDRVGGYFTRTKNREPETIATLASSPKKTSTATGGSKGTQIYEEAL